MACYIKALSVIYSENRTIRELTSQNFNKMKGHFTLVYFFSVITLLSKNLYNLPNKGDINK